jgi:hypothetical protein
VDNLASQSDNAKNFFRSLREVATLLLKPGDLDYLEERLPFTVWQLLKEDLNKKTILYRAIKDESVPLTRDLRPEVLVTNSLEGDQPPPNRTLPGDYHDCPQVRRRLALQKGTETAADRDDFFSELLLPALDAQRPGRRRISIYDPYVFQNVRRDLEKLKRIRREDAIESIGLVWLLKALSDAYADTSAKPEVTIYTTENEDNDYLELHEMKEIWLEIIQRTQTLGVPVAIRAIGSYNRKVLHLRGIFINDVRGVIMDRGMGDLNLPPVNVNEDASLALKYSILIRLSPEAARGLQAIRTVALKDPLQ